MQTPWARHALCKELKSWPCSIAGGLLWLGVLAFGVVSEQIKTRLEDSAERQNTQVPVLQIAVFSRSGQMRMHACCSGYMSDMHAGFYYWQHPHRM